MRKLVIADDEPIVTTGMSELVPWAKYGIKLCGVAQNGVEALRLVDKIRPNAIITDIRMPGMDGFALVEEAQKLVPLATFIVISGYNDFLYIQKALRLKVFDYIEKPVTVEKVDEVLQRYLLLPPSGLAEAPRQKQINSLQELRLLLQQTFVSGVLLCVRCLGDGNPLHASLQVLCEVKQMHALWVRDGNDDVCLCYHTEDGDDMTEMECSIHRLCDSLATDTQIIQVGLSQQHDNAQHLDEMLAESKTALQEAMIRDVSCISYTSLKAEDTLPFKSIEKAYVFINQYYDQVITLEQLAALCDMSPTHFSAVFKNQVGEPFVKYLLRIRMQQARKLLLAGYAPSRVWERVGFSSPQYFSDKFKRFWGCTPSRIRLERIKETIKNENSSKP